MQAYLLSGSRGGLPPLTLGELVKFRGAIWPKLGIPDIPWGPRPGELDNVACIDYPEAFDAATLKRIYTAYKGFGFTHAPIGPICDVGYHGQIPGCDFRSDFSAYLDLTEMIERSYNIRLQHFIRPDQGAYGLAWDLNDCHAILDPLFKQPRAQKLMRIVNLGWEPGGNYGFNNDWWVSMCRWMALTFPNALRGIHLPPDQDAPTGQDDDKRGFTNGQCWSNVAPYIHYFDVQNAGWTSSGPASGPTAEFTNNFLNQFDPHIAGSFVRRFMDGGPTGDWPTRSSWDKGGIKPIAFEFASFGLYWENFNFDAARVLGRAAIAIGAVGAFDGC